MKRLLILIIILSILSITVTIMIGLQNTVSREEFKEQTQKQEHAQSVQQEQIESLLNISLTNQKANRILIMETHDNVEKLLNMSKP